MAKNRSLVKTNKAAARQLAIRWAESGGADYVHHLPKEQILALAAAASSSRHGERDELLIMLMFDGCLRCSEAIGVLYGDIQPSGNGSVLKLRSKGGEFTRVAVSSSLALRLNDYASRMKLEPGQRLFPISRIRAFQIIAEAFDKAVIPRPSRDREKVGTVHILRHSGAIERLRMTANPKAVQDQLRHRSSAMTLRYMKTLSHDESLKIQQNVDFGW